MPVCSSLVAHDDPLLYTRFGRYFSYTRPLFVPTVDDLTRHLKTQFGFPEFRPGQEDVIRAVMARRDALAVMPTGQGNRSAISCLRRCSQD